MQTWSRTTKWRQGCMIRACDCNLFKSALQDTIALVISHDCDIANDNLDAEPYVEFVLGRVINEINGSYEFAKNPRILHITITLDGVPVKLELIAHKKCLIPKEQLANFEPNNKFLLEKTHILQSWLSARYRRQTLPDNLVDRLKPVFEFLEKLGKKYASGVLGFYLDYEPRNIELSKDEPYEIWLYIVYSIENSQASKEADFIEKSIAEKFEILIQKTKDLGPVELNECKAYSEKEYTLYDYRHHIEYKLEYLSNRTDAPGPILQ